MGFCSPTALKEKGIHVLPVSRSSSLAFTRNPLAGPTQQATVPLSGFPNLSAALLFPSPPCLFQAVGTLGVLPFRGSCLSRSPNASSALACLHGVCPARLRSSLPRRGLLRACSPSPRIIDEHLSVAFEAFILVRIGHHHNDAVGITATGLPLVGFCLLMVCTLVRVRNLRSEDRHASRVTTPSLDQRPAAFHGHPSTRAGSLSRENPPISRFLAFACLICFGDLPMLAYLASAY